jgi:hypothetical protein
VEWFCRDYTNNRRKLNMTKVRADEEIHLCVDLEDEVGNTTRARVDECVLETFVGPRSDPKMIPIHLDGDYKNCALTNLKWGYAITTN